MKRGGWISVAAVLVCSAALVYAVTGDVDPSFDTGSGVDDTVFAIAVQGDGKAVIGGNFLTVRGLVRNRIARVNADGTGDATFNPGTGANFAVNAIAIQPSDGKILVGGGFTSFNGDTTHPNLVRLNTDGSIDSSFTSGTGVNGPVNAIAIQADGAVVIGGSFTGINGTSRARLARLTSTGGVDGTFDPGTGVTNTGGVLQNGPVVNAIAIQPSDGKIVIGGAFSAFNGTTSFYVARLTTGGGYDNTFTSPGAYPGFTVYAVNSLAVQADGKILVAGPWNTTSGAHSILRLSGTNGSIDGTFTDPFGAFTPNVFSVLVQPADQKIVIAGNFSAVGATAKRDIARLTTTGSLDGTFDLGGTGVPTVFIHTVVMQSDNTFMIGGEFSDVVVTGRSRLERLSSSGGLDGTFAADNGVNDDVTTMSLQTSGKIAIGGPLFTTVGGIGRSHVAQLNANGTLDTGFDPGTGADNNVMGVAAQADGGVAVVGRFGHINGVTRIRVARLTSSGAVDTNFCSNPGQDRCAVSGPGADGEVDAVAVQGDGQILIGGAFLNYGPAPNSNKTRIARIGTNGIRDDSFNPGGGATGGSVLSIVVQDNGQILIAGGFTAYDSSARNHVARVNSTGSLDATFAPNIPSIIGDMYAAVPQPDGKVVVGGAFNPLAPGRPFRIDRLNSDGSFDNTFTGTGANANVHSIVVQPDGKIVIAGEFTQVNGVTRNRVARLNSDGSLDTNFDPSPGPNNYVYAMLRQPDGRLVIGGHFTAVSTFARWHIARLNTAACSFTDDPLVQFGSTVKAIHVLELRACIDGARAAHSLPAYTYTHAIVAQSTVITALDVTEMRTALNQVYDAAMQPHPTYTHPSVTAGMVISKADIAELRTAVSGAP